MSDDIEVTNPESTGTPAELVVITGLSGAGRSEAIHTFEDLGYFCIDNLPPALLSRLVELTTLPGSRIRRVAVVCDMRSMEFFETLLEELDKLEASGQPYRILYLEAAEKVLVNRFKATRRRHPLCEGGSVIEGITAEQHGLARVRERADLIIDTSDLLSAQLREAIRRRFLSDSLKDALSVTVSSFGFKYGIPIDADIVMDVRFLPNPFYVARLRHKSGLEPAVKRFVLERDETKRFMDRWLPLLADLMPSYLIEGKHHLSIALGCTGGMHRSVVLAEETADHLRSLGYDISVSHRDIRKDAQRL
ncbi:MAG TPA: RNase adapter RapZ [Coriobacteriia bacterium]